MYVRIHVPNIRYNVIIITTTIINLCCIFIYGFLGLQVIVERAQFFVSTYLERNTKTLWNELLIEEYAWIYVRGC